jgi:hypothetical protein
MKVQEWIQIISAYPGKIKKVIISGGEPFLYPDIVALVNYLLGKKILVSIATNLTTIKGLRIQNSRRLEIRATYHDNFSKQRFIDHLELYYASFHHVMAWDFNGEIPGAVTKPKIYNNEGRNKKQVIYGPDGNRFDSHVEAEMFYQKKLASALEHGTADQIRQITSGKRGATRSRQPANFVLAAASEL